MMLIFGIASAAALAVVAYAQLRSRSPESAVATIRAVRELAAVILVLTKTVEAIAEVLQGPARPAYATSRSRWDNYDDRYDLDPS